MNRRNLLVPFLVASLSGNAAFLTTTLIKRYGRGSNDTAQLTLTSEQRARFSEANAVYRVDRTLAHGKLVELRGELANEFLKDTPNRERLLKVALEMAEIQTARRPKLIEHLLLFHGLLAPSQRAAMADELRSTSACCAGCPGSSFFLNHESEH
jgi:Spy/CpxP family protein refolding chaperone